jgi:hypothetical protein
MLTDRNIGKVSWSFFGFIWAICLGLICPFATCAQSKAEAVRPLPRFISFNYDSLTHQPKGRFPDFSLSGVDNSTSTPTYPDVAHRVFKVQDYGAKANDGIDDVEAIQKAVDAAGAAGGGVVLFGPGKFDFDVKTTLQHIHIKQSNIILRGYGPGPDGTTLYDHHASDWPNKAEKWLAGTNPSFFRVGVMPNKELNKPTATITAPAVQHSSAVTVDDISNLKAGQVVLLAIKAKRNGDSSVLHYATYPSKTIGKNIANLSGDNAFKIKQLYRIKSLVGKQVTFTAPLLVPIQDDWQANLIVQDQMIERVVIEGFRLETNWAEEFDHHRNPVHDNGYDAIKIVNAANCIVNKVLMRNVSTGISVSSSLNCTITLCKIDGNRGHNGFQINGTSTRCYFERLQGGDQLHTFCFSNSASGNVIFQCLMNEPGGLDCHGGLGVYNLVDNMHGGVYASGGAKGNTPPGIGTGLVLYNWQMGSVHPYSYSISDQTLSTTSTPGLVAIGLTNLNNWPTGITVGQTPNGNPPTILSQDTMTDALWQESKDQLIKPWSLLRWLKQP